jgi:hypothetical protein
MLSEMVEKGGLGQPQDTLSTETLANYQKVLPPVLVSLSKRLMLAVWICITTILYTSTMFRETFDLVLPSSLNS